MSKISISESPISYTDNGMQQYRAREAGYRTQLKSNYISKEIPFEGIHRVVQSDFRTYSAGEFKDNYAKNDNWKGQELIILDIDDGCPTFEEAKVKFKDFEALLHTSTSHQVLKKDGEKCDRYRVILKADKPIACTADEYTKVMKLVATRIFPFIDQKCVDPARIYFGFAGCEIFYTAGTKKFRFSEYFDTMLHLQEFEKTMESIQPQKVKGDYAGSQNIISEFNAKNTVEEILVRNHYKKQGDRFISPNSSTGVAGVILSEANGKTYAYNHHSSDTWENEDAFGLYAQLEHNGNKSNAHRALTQKGN